MKLLWRLWSRYWFDLLIVAGIGMGIAVVVHDHGRVDGPYRSLWLDVPLIVAIVAPLLARRRFPFGAPVGVVAASPPMPATNGAQFFPVDLSRVVTMVFSNSPQGSTWSYLPRGQQIFQGVPFQIDGKFELTGTELLRSGTFVPPKVTGIPIGRKAERLALLHGTGWTEKEGTPLGKIVLHYAKAGNAAALESRGPRSAGSDGPEESLRIVYGVHVRNWYEEELFEDRFGRKKKPIADPNSVIAWSGNEDDPDRGTPFRLYRTTFINPRPNEVIESIDFVSF